MCASMWNTARKRHDEAHFRYMPTLPIWVLNGMLPYQHARDLPARKALSHVPTLPPPWNALTDWSWFHWPQRCSLSHITYNSFDCPRSKIICVLIFLHRPRQHWRCARNITICFPPLRKIYLNALWQKPLQKLGKSHWCIPFTATFSKRRKIGAQWSEHCDNTVQHVT